MNYSVIVNYTNENTPRILHTALLSIIGVLVIILAVGTVVGIVRSSETNPLIVFGSPVQSEHAVAGDMRVFSGLGRLRIPLADSSTMILSIAFPYSANDIAFTEELAAKINDLRVIANDYFSALPADKLIHIDEEAAKTEILRRFNNTLRLGHIQVLYFNDMLVIASE
jgi:flagellar basal body-associated protein FliL